MYCLQCNPCNVYGDPMFCTDCQYYKIKIYRRLDTSTDCTANGLSDQLPSRTAMEILNAEPHIQISSLSSPWSFTINSKIFNMHEKATKSIYASYSTLQLTDTARNFGIIEYSVS